MDGSTTPTDVRLSNADPEEATQQLDSWNRELRVLHARYRRNPLIAQDPLYALPRDLLEILIGELPDWLNPDEIHLERDLATLCQRQA